MKNYSIYSILLALWLLSGGLSAQSFLKKYANQANQGDMVSSVFAYPNGDIGLTVQNQWLGTSLKTLRTNAAGNLLSATPLSLPDNFEHYLQQDGSLVSATGDMDSLKVWKYHPDGSLAWLQIVPLTSTGEIEVSSLVTENAGGDIFVRGWYYNVGVPHFQYYVAKFSPDGVFQWINTAITNDYNSSVSVEPENAGGCLAGWGIIDTAVNSALPYYHGLWRYNSDGSTAWSIKASGSIGFGPVSRSYGSNDAGQSLVVSSNDQNFVVDSFYWMLLGPTGDTLWMRHSTTMPGLELFRPQLVLPDGTDGFVLAGSFENNAMNQFIATVTKIDLNGTVEWVRTFGPLSAPASPLSYFHSGKILSDGSILTAGLSGDDVFLLKIPADGSFYGFQNTVKGQVAYDPGLDCGIDAGDPPVSGWAITAKTTDYQLYGSTDVNGFYQIPFVDSGLYQIIITPPNYLWQACQDTVTIYFPFSATPLTDTVDFSVQTPAYCPLVEVDLTTWNLRPCTFRPMQATMCNNGPAPAEPMQLTLVLDPLLTLMSASQPFTVNGDTVTFAPDTLASLSCTTYYMNVLVSCDAQIGQSLCATAHVSPDSLCLMPPNWSGANIVVSAACVGDSVKFNIKNTGNAPTSQDLDFVIIDDHVITRMGQFNLDPEEIKEETVPADGATWRLTADQEPGHPFDQFKPSIAVEGCTTSSAFSTGMINLFANYTGSPFEDVECQEVVNSYDPNDKTGFPLGLHDYHCVEADQVLDYLIRFQNTGTATAFYVEIQDTLSPWLDPASIRTVTASHPFQWSLSGPGIVKFIFDPIALPDSNASQAGSQGFVRFQIAQRPGNPLGALLENRAGIYFDNNAAVLTNTTYHTVCENFVEVQITPVHAPAGPENGLLVYPNPAGPAFQVQLEAADFRGGQIRLLDVYGRLLWQQTAVSATTTIRRNGLANGVYFVEMEGNDGKRMVRRVVFE